MLLPERAQFRKRSLHFWTQFSIERRLKRTIQLFSTNPERSFGLDFELAACPVVFNAPNVKMKTRERDLKRGIGVDLKAMLIKAKRDCITLFGRRHRANSHAFFLIE